MDTPFEMGIPFGMGIPFETDILFVMVILSETANRFGTANRSKMVTLFATDILFGMVTRFGMVTLLGMVILFETFTRLHCENHLTGENLFEGNLFEENPSGENPFEVNPFEVNLCEVTHAPPHWPSLQSETVTQCEMVIRSGKLPPFAVVGQLDRTVDYILPLLQCGSNSRMEIVRIITTSTLIALQTTPVWVRLPYAPLPVEVRARTSITTVALASTHPSRIGEQVRPCTHRVFARLLIGSILLRYMHHPNMPIRVGGRHQSKANHHQRQSSHHRFDRVT